MQSGLQYRMNRTENKNEIVKTRTNDQHSKMGTKGFSLSHCPFISISFSLSHSKNARDITIESDI